MIGAILAAGTFASIPIVGALALRRRRLVSSRLGQAAITVTAGIAVWSVPQLGTLVIGAFRPEALGAAGWVVTAWFLLRGGIERRPSFRHITKWHWALGLGLAAAVLVYVLLPADPVVTGRDMAVYALHGTFIAEHGRLDVPYPPGLDDGMRLPPGWVGFAGIYATQPTQTVQFGPLLPAWLAQAFAVGGFRGLLALNPLLALLSAGPISAMARRLAPLPVAVLATLAVALNAGQVWVARNTLSEMLTQLLLWSAFLLLVAPARNAHAPARAWAGVFVGMAVIARIDSVVVLPLILIGHAIAGAVEPERHGPRAVAPFYATSLPIIVVAIVIYAALVAPYVADLGPALRLVAGGTIAAAVAYVAVLIPRLRRVVAGALVSAPLLGSAVVVVVALATFAYFVRPVLGPFATIEAPGHPLDGTRSHIEDAMRNLGAYVGPPTLALAVAAWLGAMVLAVRRLRAWLPVLVVIGGYSVLYFWNQSIAPDHFWAIRRFVPIILPASIILAAAAAWFIVKRLSRRARTAALAVAALALAVQTWRGGTPLYFVAERAGSAESIKQFSNAIPADQTYLGVFSADNARSLATPLLLLGDRQVVPLDVFSSDGRLEVLRRLELATEAAPVYIITSLVEDAAPMAGDVLARVQHDYAFMSPTTNPPPSQIGHASFELLAMRVTAFDTIDTAFGSSASWLTPDDGFYPPETVDGVTGRWTDGDATITIPVSGRDARHIAIDLVAPVATDGTDLIVTVNEIPRVSTRVPPGEWSRIIDLPGRGISDEVEIRIESGSFVPAQIGSDADDERDLGVFVRSITISGAGD